MLMYTESLERRLGERMLRYEIDCCLKGLRAPLPNTPTLAKGKGTRYIRGNIRVLLKLYGTITEELLTKTCGIQDKYLVSKYIRVWRNMR